MIVAGGDDGADAGKMRRMSDGGQHLRGADVGAATHADLAVGIGQRGRPLHRVVAVIRFVLEGVPLAVGGVAAADVLNDDDVAASGAPFTPKPAESRLSYGVRSEEPGNCLRHLGR